ncbi:MAG: universal stress protein [Candidatus Obscuribacterales bacterium]|nr:universal stress protein [Candidatus Obscuribacterales bacterium]
MKVLIALDESKFADVALDAVSTRSWPAGTEFRLLSVVELGRHEYEGLDASSVPQLKPVQEKLIREVKGSLESRAGSLQSKFDGCTVDVKVLQGQARDVIVNEARDWCSDCLILGSHGRKGIQKFLLGSVAESMLGHAPCTVEVVKSATGVSGGAVGDLIVLIAIQDMTCVALLGAYVAAYPWPKLTRFKVAHVVHPVLVNSYMSLLPSALTENIAEARRKEGAEFVRRCAEHLKEVFGAEAVEEVLIEGDAKSEIVELEKEWHASVVVLGSHGKTGVGSVSRAIVSHSQCSAMVVPIERDKKKIHIIV